MERRRKPAIEAQNSQVPEYSADSAAQQDLPEGVHVAPASPLRFVAKQEQTLLTGFEAKGARLGTTVAALKEQFGLDVGVIMRITDADSHQTDMSGILRTGQTVTLEMDEQNVLWATIVVAGEVLGIGHMNLTQIVRLVDAYVGTKLPTGAFFEAGDSDGNGTISLTDLVMHA